MIEKLIENTLFAARWIMAPFYLGLIIALAVLFFKFAQELVHFVTHAVEFTEEETILGALAMIDLTLMGSLILIVVYSGYENFVSRIKASEHEDWPEWMTKVDFAQLKQKLLASIVLISGIQVLKAFMSLEKMSDRDLYWLIGVHMVFVISGVAFALSDWLQSKTGKDSH
ncbi:MAG: TIGR00645 family protein [Hyphomicrobiales bacterium]